MLRPIRSRVRHNTVRASICLCARRCSRARRSVQHRHWLVVQCSTHDGQLSTSAISVVIDASNVRPRQRSITSEPITSESAYSLAGRVPRRPETPRRRCKIIGGICFCRTAYSCVPALGAIRPGLYRSRTGHSCKRFAGRFPVDNLDKVARLRDSPFSPCCRRRPSPRDG